MIIIKIFYSILFILLGMGLIKYRKTVKSWTGSFYWAENYIGTGGTYMVIVVSGMLLIFYGIIYPFGGMELLIGK